jgi:hypothetical protein
MLNMTSVRLTLQEFYALDHETASRWAAFFVNRDLDWNYVHSVSNMAICSNLDVEDVWKFYEGWIHEKTNKVS